MSAHLSPSPLLRFFGQDGKPLSGGFLITYDYQTSSPRATWADAAMTSRNPVQIPLDANGSPSINGHSVNLYLEDGASYHYRWFSSDGSPVGNAGPVQNNGGTGGGGCGLTPQDIKPLHLLKNGTPIGDYTPLDGSSIDVPSSVAYVSEQTENLYGQIVQLLIADIMPVLMRSDTDPNVQGVTRDHYYYPAARTGVNSDYEFIGYDGDRVEVARVHQDNSVTYSVKPNGVHRLMEVYQTESDPAPYGFWIVDLEKPNPDTPSGYDWAYAHDLIEGIRKGEVFVLYPYQSFVTYMDSPVLHMTRIEDQSGVDSLGNHFEAVRIFFDTCTYRGSPASYAMTSIYTPDMNDTSTHTGRMAVLDWRGVDRPFMEFDLADASTVEYESNKVQSLDNNSSHYPSCPAVISYVAGAMPAASTATPAMDGVASAGSSTSWARGDHVHPTDSSREAVANRTTTVRITGADDTHYPTEAAVRSAIDSAVSSAYHAAGTKTVSQLTSTLLDPLYLGCVYNITDSGMTTADFVDGAGHPIVAGDNVGICDVGGGVYKFDLLSGFVDLSTYVQKSSTAGLLKNDGSVDTNDYLPKTGDGKDVTATFMTASSRANISTGEKLSVILGKVAKWFADIKALAFKDSVSDGDISGTIQDDHIASSASWSAKYDKPSTGIPASDMSSAVQTSLGKADTAIQDVSGKLDKTGDASNATSSLTKNSGDTSDMTSGGKLSAIFTAISNAFATFFSHVLNTSNPHNVTKSQVGLSSVVNTGDSATPVEGGTTKLTTGGAYTELAKKVDKESGKGLSSNDFTNAYKSDIDNNSAARHTHSAGTGLKSSLTSGVVTTSTNVERLSSSANVSLPENSFSIVEMTDAATNLPQSGYCHILTSQGYDPTYTVQLSLGMTYDGAFLRKKYAGTWGAWVRLMDMAEHGQRAVFWNDASSYAGGNSNRYFRLATISSEALQNNINNVWRAIVSTDSVIEVAYLRLKVRLNAAGNQPVGNLNVSPIGTWSGAVSFVLVLRGVVGNVGVDIWVHHEGGYRSTVISDMGGGSFNLTSPYKNNWTYTSYNNDGSSSIPTDADTQIINAVVD